MLQKNITLIRTMTKKSKDLEFGKPQREKDTQGGIRELLDPVLAKLR